MSAEQVLDTYEPAIPSRRLTPKSHLQLAAKAPVASNAERYHLQAATAEALMRILEVLERIEKRESVTP